MPESLCGFMVLLLYVQRFWYPQSPFNLFKLHVQSASSQWLATITSVSKGAREQALFSGKSPDQALSAMRDHMAHGAGNT